MIESLEEISHINYTYKYLDPRKNNQEFYIGEGKDDRYLHHLEDANRYVRQNRSQKWIQKNCSNPHKIRTILKILKAGLEPIIVKVLENVDKQTAVDEEIRLIALYGRYDLGLGTLTNMTDGGDGAKNSLGKKWYNNGIEDKYFIDGEQPEGWNLGFLSSQGKNNPMYGSCRTGELNPMYGKIGGATGYKWYNDGFEDRYIKEDEIPEGWISGRLATKGERNGVHKINQEGKYNSNYGNRGKKNPLFGKKWYNNGKDQGRFNENKQPKGWNLGRI